MRDGDGDRGRGELDTAGVTSVRPPGGAATTVLELEADEGWGAYEVVVVAAGAALHETAEGVGVAVEAGVQVGV